MITTYSTTVRLLTYFVSTVIFCHFLFPVLAQPTRQSLRQYSMQQGLAGDLVSSLLQDDQGFIWAGTVNGLNKFDGYHFNTYRPVSGDATGLAHGVVNCLWEDKNNRLWIGTINGLDFLDLKTEKYSHLRLDSTDRADIEVRKIRERKDGKAWVCTSHGVFLVDPESLTITKPIDLSETWDIAETSDGMVWVSTNQGIAKLNKHLKQLTRYTHNQDDPSIQVHKTIYVDSLDRIWIGGAKNVYLFDPETSRFHHFIPQYLPSESKLDVKVIVETTGGKLLIGSTLGLDLFDPSTGKFEQLIEASVWSILRDQQKNLWVGTTKGIYQSSPNDPKLTIIHHFESTEVFDVEVTTIDNDDHIWMVTKNPNLVFRYDPYSGAFTRYSHDPNNPLSFSGDQVYDIIPSEDAGVWIASYHQLEKFNPKDQSFRQIALPFILTKLLMDSKNRLWIGGYQQFGQYNLSNHTFKPTSGFKEHTTCAIEDQYNNIWIGTRAGLFRYNSETEELQVFKRDPLNPLGLSNSWISCLMIDKQGAVWVGTLDGLNKIVPGTESSQPEFIYWNTSNSKLPFDAIAGIVDGADGTLWISCGNQVSHFFPEEGIFRNYDQNDGLHGGVVYGGHKGPSGEIYMSSRDGLVVFHPDSLRDNNYVPPVVITALTINNQPVHISGSRINTSSWKSPLATAVPYAESLELRYEHRDFSLEFAALNYINPENNRYKYRLEPYESNWIETSSDNRIARYTNINPGNYTFRVIGSNNDGIWNEQGATLLITLNPPMWATWWAYALYLLFAASLVMTMRYYEKKRVILRQQARSLKELDKTKSEFFTNISHELRTPLTLILGPLKALQQGKYQGDRQYLYSVMSQNGRRLLQLVNQLLDLSKLDQGKLKLELQDCNIDELVQQVLSNFDSACTLKKLEMIYHNSQGSIFCRVDVEKIRQVLYNLVCNAFKFTPENGHISVTVNSVKEEQQGTQQELLKIMVKDSGVGIPIEDLDQIFDRFYQVKNTHQEQSEGTGIGLALTKKLVELHDGTIEVESEPGWGAAFTVRLPFIAAEGEPIITMPGEKAKPTLTEEVPDYLDTSQTQTQIYNQKPTLLLVEDNAQMRQYIRLCLGEEYQYFEAANGEDGLQFAANELPDLILCDVMMPKMDGYVFCQEIRQNEVTRHIPFIFLTAKADPESRIQGLETGSNDYVTKPFEAEELRLKVRNHLDKMRQFRSYFSKQLAYKGDIDLVESLDDKFLNRAILVVKEHLDRHEFAMEEFAMELGLSKTQLYRKLVALTGQPPSAFIRGIRLKKAAQLIVQEFGNTSEVAYAVGFNNLSYFTKCFKEQFGEVPSGYGRKRVSD